MGEPHLATAIEHDEPGPSLHRSLEDGQCVGGGLVRRGTALHRDERPGGEAHPEDVLSPSGAGHSTGARVRDVAHARYRGVPHPSRKAEGDATGAVPRGELPVRVERHRPHRVVSEVVRRPDPAGEEVGVTPALALDHEGVRVHEESKPVSPPSDKPTRTEFHISKPSPWPAGDYKVVLTVDGQPSQTQTFTVSKATAKR